MTLTRSTALAALAGGFLAATAPGGAQALPQVRIGTDPVDSFGEAYFGDTKGIFRDNGIDPIVTSYANGSTIVQGVAAGDLDVGLSNIVQAAAAFARGIPVQMIAPAALYSAQHSYSEFCVAKNSPLRTPKDFAGQTIAVSTLNDFNQLGVSAWLEHNGVAPAQVKFVELKFPEMGPALARGTVGAAVIVEPALSGAIKAGQARVFAEVYDVIGTEFASIVWFANKSWLQKSPDAAKKLIAGIYATARWANAHQAESGAILAGVAKIDPAIVAGMSRAYYATSNDPKFVQAPLDFAFHYGLLPRAIPFAEFNAGL